VITTPPVWNASRTGQLALDVLFGAAALATLAYCLRAAYRERATWPLYVFVGASLCILYEPFNNVLAHCAYPANQTTELSALGRHIPLFIGFVYMFYFGIPVTWLMSRFAAGVTRRQLGTYYAIAVTACGAFEPIFAHQRMWRYYGPNQALDFTGMPMFWWFANAMCIFAIAAGLHGLRTHVLDRPRQHAVFALGVPLGLFAAHGSASIPVFIAMSGGASRTWSTVASLATIALSLLYMRVIALAVCTDRPPAAPGRVHTRPERVVEHV
jgi:hypothetical protein